MKVTYIIARYEENIDWLKPIMKHCIIYNKGKKLNIPNEVCLENVGRESHSYLKYIIDNYDNLADICIFSQGDIHDHINRKTNPVYYYLMKQGLEAFQFGTSMPRRTMNRYSNDMNWGSNPKIIWADEFKDGNHISFLQWFRENISKKPLKNKLYFYTNALFAVTKKKIKHRPKSYYENLIKQVDWHVNPVEGHYFERSWYYIFNS
jgi:hypothetical protein